MQNGIFKKEVQKTMVRTVKGVKAVIMTIEDGQTATREIMVTETQEKAIRREIKKQLSGRDFLLVSIEPFEKKYQIADVDFFKYATEITE